jgi:endonuclease/exonuclease/phosphatase family metal-dependent hydrolase
MSIDNCDSSFRVMTYNVRFDQVEDDQNQWEFRKNRLISLIQDHESDLLGVQEPLPEQVADLKEALPEFDEYGVGCDDGDNQGEFNIIFYRFARFELLDKGTFWLSETPDIPGSKGWDANKTRICSWVKLRDRQTQQSLYYFNTHFDHSGVTARLESARLLLARIQTIADSLTPVILTGDLNTDPDSDPYHTITTNSSLQDAINLTETPHDGPNGTWTTFSVAENIGDRIDYIFVTPQNIRVLKHAILTDSNNEYYPSNHLPVLAEIAIKDDSVPAQNMGVSKHTTLTAADNEYHSSVLAKIVLKNNNEVD